MNLEIYSNTDILVGCDSVSPYGFNKDMTFKEMVSLAIEHKCPIIVKNGRGKWYLKGQGKTIEQLRGKIEENKGKYERRSLWLLEPI